MHDAITNMLKLFPVFLYALALSTLSCVERHPTKPPRSRTSHGGGQGLDLAVRGFADRTAGDSGRRKKAL